MCNLINIHTYIHFNKYTYIHRYIDTYIHTYIPFVASDQRFS